MSRRKGLYWGILLLMFALSSTLPANADQAHKNRKAFVVSSRTIGWQPTGLSLKQGDIFSITASGSVNIWPNCQATKVAEGFPDVDCSLVQKMGPTGTTVFDPAEDNYPLPSAAVGALAAKVGDGTPFLVGNGGTFTAQNDGLLQLAFNDILKMQDNSGAYFGVATIPNMMALPAPNSDWIDLGVVLKPGQAFSLVATGTVNLWPKCGEEKADKGFPNLNCALVQIDPSGSTGFDPASSGFSLPGALVGAVIARIGDGPAFLVGKGGTFTAKEGGTLFVRINDLAEATKDDIGSFSVGVIVEPEGKFVYIPGTLNRWQRSGIALKAGQSVTIDAGGMLDLWPRCEREKERAKLPNIDCSKMRMGPAGTEAVEPAKRNYPLPDARVGSLVARIGNGKPFLVSDGGTFTASANGELQFRINDIFGMGDNSGGFVAVVLEASQ
jgi:hypothetical protein